MSQSQLRDEIAPSPLPSATSAIDAHIARLRATMERVEAEQRVEQKIKDFVAKDNAERVAQKIAKDRAEWDNHLKDMKDSLAKPPVQAATAPSAHGGVMSIMQPSVTAPYMRPQIAARDTDGLRPGPPSLFSDTTMLIALTIALALAGFCIFARRRLAWCAARVAAKFAEIMRWLRMDEPDEI